jgi:hypothetical protein
MSLIIHCKSCGKKIAVIRDAAIHNAGIICYCAKCDEAKNERPDVPDFLNSFLDGFKGKK